MFRQALPRATEADRLAGVFGTAGRAANRRGVWGGGLRRHGQFPATKCNIA
jgi:hypothetical protein